MVKRIVNGPTNDLSEVDERTRRWRLDHISVHREATPWLAAAADQVVDTTDLTPDEVGAAILADLARREESAPDVGS